jgi:SSS family solute:Na+ symporter
MSIIDIIIIIAYFAMIIAIGFYIAKKHVKTGTDAAVAGRKLGIFLGGIGKAANSAGGSSSVGGTAWGYSLGISGMWYAVSEGMTYILYMPIIKRIWRVLYRTRTSSVGNFFGYRWGKGAILFGGITNAVAYMAFVGAQIIATATVIRLMLGWNYTAALLVSTAIIIVYCTAGGLRAIVITDVIQMSLIIAGMLIIMPPIVFGKAGPIAAAAGGSGHGIIAVWDAIKQSDVISYMVDFGGPTAAGFGWPYVIGAIILPTLLIAGVAQAAFQYQAAIESADKALKSFIMVPFLYIPVSIAVVLMGMCAMFLYGPAYLPEVVGGGGLDPNMILSQLIGDFLPKGLTGFLLAAILSATMSTSSTCLICSVTCLTEDVIKPFQKKKLDPKQSLFLFRVCMVVVGFGTIGITLWATDIITLLTTAYAAVVAGLWVPMMATLFVKKATKPATYITMIVGLVLYGLMSFAPDMFSFLPANIVASPLYLTLPISIVLQVVLSICTQKSDHGRIDAYFTDEWEKSPGNWEKHPEVLEEGGTAPA